MPPIQPTEKPSFSFPEKTQGLNFFETDFNLIRTLERIDSTFLGRYRDTLSDLGEFAGGRLEEQAVNSDQHFPPVLKDLVDSAAAPQKRKNKLVLNSEYEDCQQELYRRGLVADCFDKKKPAPHMLAFVAQYMVSKTDIATGCPFAMTHPVALVLDQIAPADVKAKYLPELLRTDGKATPCGTWATEKHSGSDIGQSETKAVRNADGDVHLYGHNWFTSAFGFNKFLAVKTARPDGAPDGSKGLGLYLVPSHIDEEWDIPNNYEITHLKQKLGTKGLPTVEVELNGVLAYEIAPPGKGLKAMMTALGCSRVHNAMGAAGTMHRAYLEAVCWASNRETFGKKIIERPMVQERILGIQCEWMAGSALAFEAAHSYDKAVNDPAKAAWSRIATALAKYKTAEQATWCSKEALKLVAGNGYTEEYPVARQYRDTMVLSVWEGPEQIQALELMRMLSDDSGAVYLDRLEHIADNLPAVMERETKRLQGMKSDIESGLEDMAQNPDKLEQSAGRVLESMAEVLSYALLCEEAAWEAREHKSRHKLLVSDFHYQRHFERNIRPSIEIHSLQKAFKDAVQGNQIPFRPVIKPSSPEA